MEVSIGSGENQFSMSRGSFKYKQKISGKRKLTLQNQEKTEEGYLLTYVDPKGSSAKEQVHQFAVTQQGSQIRLAYVGEEKPGVNRYWLDLCDQSKGAYLRLWGDLFGTRSERTKCTYLGGRASEHRTYFQKDH